MDKRIVWGHKDTYSFVYVHSVGPAGSHSLHAYFVCSKLRHKRGSYWRIRTMMDRDQPIGINCRNRAQAVERMRLMVITHLLEN